MSNPFFIGISGRREAGKDTLAAALVGWLKSQGRNAARVAFADDIKYELHSKFNVDLALCHGSNADKETLVPGTQCTIRKALQHIGQGYIVIDPLYWVKRAFELARCRKLTVAVISDVRYPHEVQAIQAQGGVVLRLTRCVHPTDTHASETALDGYAGFDHTIHNNYIGPDDVFTFARLYLMHYQLTGGPNGH